MFCLQRLHSAPQIVQKVKVINSVPRNNLWQWLTFVWNRHAHTVPQRVSQSRIDQVGPDRACAEWLMRNGALVQWKGHSKFVPHYDSLPKDDDPGKYYLQEVDATDSSISHHGFPYFRHCDHVDKIKLQECLYLDDSALSQLHYLKSSLHSLSIIKCYGISKKGLLSLGKLQNLKELQLSGLKSLERNELDVCIEELSKQLPHCEIKVSENIAKEGSKEEQTDK
ncbi:ATP synthase subunit s, mitochondrial isoform X2 [Macrosteles quadrilineatus]|uniref:ATP synthase subunit s, mitochondrial isoform X2 n=1 Tax=Macrosteles quadrilineatus TaxID=74068 RepID=UPI0023E253DE|nr:ATP synthase subunit s, mitochondrial isoform X2 [Macrosteles quadrilineatus]